MPRPKSSMAPLLTHEQIKSAARDLMAEHGTAGLSLRGIARRLGVTAPSLYNYFPRLEDLITELIVDAYTHQAEHLEMTASRNIELPPGERLLEVLLAYRRWALENSTQFNLIYGNPIPGYHAPPEVTAQAAQRVFSVILAILQEARQKGLLQAPTRFSGEYVELALSSPDISRPDQQVAEEVLFAGVVGWYRIHGLIVLELYGHTSELISNNAQFYEDEARALLEEFGLRSSST